MVSAKGLYLTGMTNRVPWGLQIVMAVYYIGLSAGSLVISGLYGVFGKLEYKPFARIAVYLAMLFLVAGLLSILTDQGRLDRVFVQPFVHYNIQSMFSINPILYIGHILICVVYLFALFKEMRTLTKVTAVIAFGWAFCVHTGTGAIFGFGARMLYESPLLPASFVGAAMASGTALMILVIVAVFKLTHRHVDDGLVLWLGRFLAVCILVVVYFLVVENAYRAYVVELRHAAMYYLFGGLHSVLAVGGERVVLEDLDAASSSDSPILLEPLGPPATGIPGHRRCLWPWGSTGSPWRRTASSSRWTGSRSTSTDPLS